MIQSTRTTLARTAQKPWVFVTCLVLGSCVTTTPDQEARSVISAEFPGFVPSEDVDLSGVVGFFSDRSDFEIFYADFNRDGRTDFATVVSKARNAGYLSMLVACLSEAEKTQPYVCHVLDEPSAKFKGGKFRMSEAWASTGQIDHSATQSRLLENGACPVDTMQTVLSFDPAYVRCVYHYVFDGMAYLAFCGTCAED